MIKIRIYIFYRRKFGNVSIYQDINSSDPWAVTHIAEDLYIPGNILFSSDNSLKTTDGESNSIIAGSETPGYTNGIGVEARFNFIGKFMQINSTDIIIVDVLNFCFRYFVRSSEVVTPFVGQCTKRGSVAGSIESVKFYRITDALLGKGRSANTLFILEEYSVLYMNINSYLVITLVYFPAPRPFDYLTGLVLDPNTDGGSLLLLANTEIRNVSTPDLKKIRSLTQSTISFKAPTNRSIDGKFSEASYAYCDRIVSITNGVYVISYNSPLDTGRLRIIDFVTQYISSICVVSKSLFLAGKISRCVIPHTSGLAVIKDVLYIGGTNVIYQIPSKYQKPLILLAVFR